MNNSSFTIVGRLPSLNEYILANRSNRFGANAMKKKCEQSIFLALSQAEMEKVYKYPIGLKITWYEQNSRRDIDNITFATKFILDSMVKNGILEDDSQKFVKGIEHTVLIDKVEPRIEVEIFEWGNNGNGRKMVHDL